jgi:uncharacterized membrane protein YidH (DUF202 family)
MMDRPADAVQRAGLSDYLAAERTLLAWIRTGLALMGFGFVVARFGLFLRQLEFLQHAPAAQSYGLSLWFGTALIVAGVIVNGFAGWRHIKFSPAAGSRRHVAPRLCGPDRRGSIFSGIGWAGHGHLSRFCSNFHSLITGKQ